MQTLKEKMGKLKKNVQNLLLCTIVSFYPAKRHGNIFDIALKKFIHIIGE